ESDGHDEHDEPGICQSTRARHQPGSTTGLLQLGGKLRLGQLHFESDQSLYLFTQIAEQRAERATFSVLVHGLIPGANTPPVFTIAGLERAAIVRSSRFHHSPPWLSLNLRNREVITPSPGSRRSCDAAQRPG